jgi:serine/threonine-protein kinase
MGAVYKASDPALDRVVAIKTINPALLAGGDRHEDYLERFRREAKAAGRLSHPGIVSVFDLGLDDATATPFIVMEYVPGVSLEAVLQENPRLPLDQAMEIVEQVASALDEAHRNGIVHRDVKPANIFLDDRGRVKVGDFGVARLEGSDLTQAGVRVGTPAYTAPEVLQGGTADARADVFALGVVAYRVLTGERPFKGAVPEAVGIDILQREPAPPAAVRAEIPAEISAAVMRALAKSPDARTPSARDFLGELRAAARDSVAPPSMPASIAGAENPTGRGRRARLVALVLAAAVVLGVGTLLAIRAHRERPEAGAAVPATKAPGGAATAPTVRPRPPAASPASGAGEAAPGEARAAEEARREGDEKDPEKPRERGRKGKGRKKK